MAKDERLRDTRMRFEQWAHNPTCEANTMSAVYNVRMAEVAKAEGYKPTFGQSPFAIARGDNFERLLFRSKAEILIPALIEKEILPKSASGLADIRIRANGGNLPTLDEAIEATKELVAEVASATGRSKKDLPAVAAGATVRIPRGVMLPEAILILDVLAIRADGDRPELIVGEIKTYPDRGGHTDSRELALARAQAGIYLHALRLVAEELKVQDRVRLSQSGFLVLTKPGSNRPSVRAGEDLRFQAERARRGFELLEKAALALPKMSGDGAVDAAALVQAVMRAESNYSEACLSFCDRRGDPGTGLENGRIATGVSAALFGIPIAAP
jgi:hypothetical protein